MKRRLCLLLAAVCLLTFSGCDAPPETDDPVTESEPTVTEEVTTAEPQKFLLAYSHDDTLNPFTAATEVNCQLTGLLYESLTTLTADFEVQPLLAASVEQTDPTHLTVTLRKGAVFSDGSAVTPADVVASYKAAKKSQRYKALLTNVASATVRDATVVFTLTAADPNASATLTFPVVKEATLTDEAAKAPLGSGVYRLKATDTGATLVRNKHHSQKPHYTTVYLQHLPNTAARQYALASGSITYYFDDLSDGNTPRVTGASRPVEMNAMVFMGINGTKGKLANATVRRALSLLTDRSAMVESAYAGYATASVLPFQPKWKALTDYRADAKQDVDTALTLLEEAGCTAKDGVRLSLELIYSTARPDRAKVADAIRTQLEQGGVAVTLVPLTEAEYRDCLKKGRYDLYVGEIRLTADMSLRPLLAGGDASYGVSRSGAAATAYRKYLAGDLTVTEFLAVFGEDLPYLPLCWRQGVAAYDRGVTTLSPTGYDPYGGFATWK